jgi:hypothetical protein
MILRLMAAALAFVLAICPANAKKKQSSARDAAVPILTTLQKQAARIPKCTVRPELVEMSLAKAHERLWDAFQTTKVDRQAKGKKNIFDEYFGHKDELAAKRLGMTLREYALRLSDELAISGARMIAAMAADGLHVGITSIYRDPWRQALATGRKANTYSSYHGSRPELGGKSAALDLSCFSNDGDRAAQLRCNPQVYAWVERHGKTFNICRPYGDRDAPHVGLCTDKEYLSMRGKAKLANAMKSKRKKQGRRHVAQLVSSDIVHMHASQ